MSHRGCSEFLLWRQRRILSHLCLSPLPLHVSIKKKKSVSPHDSHPSERSQPFQGHSSTSRLCVRQIENEQQSTVGEVSQLRNRAAGGHGASWLTVWPGQRCTKSPGIRQLAEWKETKKIPELVPEFQHCTSWWSRVKLHFRCCHWCWRYILPGFGSSTNIRQSLFICRALRALLTVSPVRSTHDHCTR